MRFSLKSLSTLFLLSAAVASIASVAFTPHPGFATPPQYWSGTFCKANYRAEVAFPSTHIYSCVVTIGGEQVYSDYAAWSGNSRDPRRKLVEPSIMFDSTHFSHGSTVEVEITITTDAGVFTHSYQSNAFNQIRAWSANYTPPGWFNSAGLVDQLIGSTEIPVLDTYGGNWSKDDFLNTMDEASVLYICSHGYTDSLTAQNWDLISWAEMESVRAAQMGQGNHPYNSTGVPAINFFHIDTCKAGANNNFIRACYPYINAYGNLLQDQAILGYVPSVSISSIQTMTQAIWGALSTGETVNEAKEALCQSGVQVTDTGEFYRPIRENDVAIYGDIYTRVTGLYTGNDYHASSWFKVY